MTKKLTRVRVSNSGRDTRTGTPGAAKITSGISNSGSARATVAWRRGGRRAKARMKVSRYRISGTTHSSGAEAMSVVMWVVTPSSSEDGTNANAVQRRR